MQKYFSRMPFRSCPKVSILNENAVRPLRSRSQLNRNFRTASKLKWRPFVYLAAVILAITFVANIVLAVSRKNIIQKISTYYEGELSIDKISFLPPNIITLKNFSLGNDPADTYKKPLVLPKVKVNFSFYDLFVKKRFSISAITVTSFKASYPMLTNFWRDNREQIFAVLNRLPRSDTRIHVKEALLKLTKDAAVPDYVSVNLNLVYKGDFFAGGGSLRQDQYALLEEGDVRKYKRTAQGLPLRYSFKGFMKSRGNFSLDSILLRRNDFYVKLWGGYRDNSLQLSGFSFIDTLSDKRGYQTIPVSFVEKIKFFLRDLINYSPIEELAKINVYLLDADSYFRIAFPEVQIERLEFMLNKMPVSATGKLVFGDPFSVDLDLSFLPARSKIVKIKNLKKVDMRTRGTLTTNSFKGNCLLKAVFEPDLDSSIALEKVITDLQDFNLSIDEYSRLNISLISGSILCLTKGNAHRLSFRDLTAYFNFRMNDIKYGEVHSSFYDGELDGKIWVDTTKVPPRITSNILIREADPNELQELLVHFSKIQGSLFADINFNSYPTFDLKGKVDILDGSLINFAFFNWVSDSFDLPSLKMIDFDQAKAKFTVTPRGIGLADVELDSADVDINGYFQVDSNSLVASKLSLSFTRELLTESRKFTPILKQLEQSTDDEDLDFDFQLSGNLHAMNFQWLPSALKKMIQDLIPDFIERRIEQSVSDAFEATVEE